MNLPVGKLDGSELEHALSTHAAINNPRTDRANFVIFIFSPFRTGGNYAMCARRSLVDTNVASSRLPELPLFTKIIQMTWSCAILAPDDLKGTSHGVHSLRHSGKIHNIWRFAALPAPRRGFDATRTVDSGRLQPCPDQPARAKPAPAGHPHDRGALCSCAGGTGRAPGGCPPAGTGVQCPSGRCAWPGIVSLHGPELFR